jgi:hypothetical protein
MTYPLHINQLNHPDSTNSQWRCHTLHNSFRQSDFGSLISPAIPSIKVDDFNSIDWQISCLFVCLPLGSLAVPY